VVIFRVVIFGVVAETFVPFCVVLGVEVSFGLVTLGAVVFVVLLVPIFLDSSFLHYLYFISKVCPYSHLMHTFVYILKYGLSP